MSNPEIDTLLAKRALAVSRGDRNLLVEIDAALNRAGISPVSVETAVPHRAARKSRKS